MKLGTNLYCNAAKLSMTICNNDQFNCNDGGCIPLNSWCDSNALNDSASCADGSDELNCSFAHDLSGYNKGVIPTPYPYTELLIYVEILNIQDISAMNGRLRISLNLSMEWKEPRVAFHGIWENKLFNKADEKEQEMLWKPKVVFSNMIMKEFELLTKPEMVIDCNYNLIPTNPEFSDLYNNYIYNNCSLFSTALLRYNTVGILHVQYTKYLQQGVEKIRPKL